MPSLSSPDMSMGLPRLMSSNMALVTASAESPGTVDANSSKGSSSPSFASSAVRSFSSTSVSLAASTLTCSSQWPRSRGVAIAGLNASGTSSRSERGLKPAKSVLLSGRPAGRFASAHSFYVADGQRVLIATLPVTADTAQQAIGPKLRLLHRGFKEVHGVAARNGRCGQIVAVADAKLHSVSILELDSGGAVAMVTVWGDGSQDARYGPSTHLALNEPVGLAFDGAVLLVGCFGGAKHGSLVAITPTEFACELLSQLHACYKACGFVSPRATKEERSARL